MRGAEEIRAAIAEGVVYQANPCRVLSAPVRGEITGLGRQRLAEGNPAPHAMTLRLPGLHAMTLRLPVWRWPVRVLSCIWRGTGSG